MARNRVALTHPATMADLEALPPQIKGEIIDGVLYTQPRPRSNHANLVTALSSALYSPFQKGRGGPGGWWIFAEPGIEVPGSPEFSPDLAGWRKERMPRPPTRRSISVVPDWACGIVSPSTRTYDQSVKRAFYSRIGIGFLWFIDPTARTLSVSKLGDGLWVELAVHAENAVVRAEPFAAIELELAELWLPGDEEE